MDQRCVRTYAPFERGWLPVLVYNPVLSAPLVRTYAPFERGWLHNPVLSAPLHVNDSQDLRPV